MVPRPVKRDLDTTHSFFATCEPRTLHRKGLLRNCQSSPFTPKGSFPAAGDVTFCIRGDLNALSRCERHGQAVVSAVKRIEICNLREEEAGGRKRNEPASSYRECGGAADTGR
jgi:hypothetical protein